MQKFEEKKKFLVEKGILWFHMCKNECRCDSLKVAITLSILLI